MEGFWIVVECVMFVICGFILGVFRDREMDGISCICDL